MLMLSGGMDSRLMAGYLHEAGLVDQAVVLGRSDDYEVRAAGRVAACLQLRLCREAQEPTARGFLQAARHVARWEHVSGGFSALENHCVARWMGQLSPFFWSGFTLDGTLGGRFPNCVRARADGLWWKADFDRHNAWGVAVEDLAPLLRAHDARQLVDSVVADFRRDYEQGDLLPWQRSMRLLLANRVRFHVGGALHRLSLGSWPLLPMLDRRLVELLLSLPPQLLALRGLQRLLLQARFPSLATIALDTNSFRFDPAGARWWPKLAIAGRVGSALKRQASRCYWQHWRRQEPRRYVRYFDVDGPLWRPVREAAQLHRGMLSPWLDRAQLDRLLPAADVDLDLPSPFAEAAATRTLLGLIFWTAQAADQWQRAA
jgi:asparagine synthase (glutamine-hydrolysing)